LKNFGCEVNLRFAGAGQICWNRFTGPGRIALQSMYLHMESGE
jgi:hypothetical protein